MVCLYFLILSHLTAGILHKEEFPLIKWVYFVILNYKSY